MHHHSATGPPVAVRGLSCFAPRPVKRLVTDKRRATVRAPVRAASVADIGLREIQMIHVSMKASPYQANVTAQPG